MRRGSYAPLVIFLQFFLLACGVVLYFTLRAEILSIWIFPCRGVKALTGRSDPLPAASVEIRQGPGHQGLDLTGADELVHGGDVHAELVVVLAEGDRLPD